jgi:D-sedoheptulose 7-phosphate isomerase
MRRATSHNGRNGLAATDVELSPAERYSAGLLDTLKRVPFEQVNRAVAVLVEAYRNERAIFLFGNGGSASLASHLACDLGKGTACDGTSRLRVLALTDNIPLITAWANDTRYEEIFAEQLRNFVRSGDVVVAISGSGNSPNVLSGLAAAKEHGAFRIVLTGFTGGKAAGLADLAIVVPSNDMQYIEDAHLTIAHSIFRAVRDEISATHLKVSAAGAP